MENKEKQQSDTYSFIRRFALPNKGLILSAHLGILSFCFFLILVAEKFWFFSKSNCYIKMLLPRVLFSVAAE